MSNHPKALIRKRADMVADICAWCPDKEAADRIATEGGYDLNHTICPDCQAKLTVNLPMTERAEMQKNYAHEEPTAIKAWLARNPPDVSQKYSPPFQSPR